MDKAFIAFNHNRHPRELGEEAIQEFLTHLAVDVHVSASSQNQALSAILFLYKKALGVDLKWMDDIVRARRPVRVPIVMTRSEVKKSACRYAWCALAYGQSSLRQRLSLKVE